MIPVPEAFRVALVNCPTLLGPAFVLDRYAAAARSVHQSIEWFGRERAARNYRELLNDAPGSNPYNAAWRDAFGGTTS